jgi:hypothetical protein
MKATYDLTTRELIVESEEIITLTVVVPQDQEEDYWNTVKGKDGAMLYDINLFDYGDYLQLQYVDLVTDDDGELTCGDNYQLGSLTVIESIPSIEKDIICKVEKILYVKWLTFLEWYAKDNEDLINIGQCVIDSLKKDKIVKFTVEDFFHGMVELGCIPSKIISNIEDIEDFEGDATDLSEYTFKLID